MKKLVEKNGKFELVERGPFKIVIDTYKTPDKIEKDMYLYIVKNHKKDIENIKKGLSKFVEKIDIPSGEYSTDDFKEIIIAAIANILNYA